MLSYFYTELFDNTNSSNNNNTTFSAASKILGSGQFPCLVEHRSVLQNTKSLNIFIIIIINIIIVIIIIIIIIIVIIIIITIIIIVIIIFISCFVNWLWISYRFSS